MTPFKIVPTVGVGPLRFGMTRDQVSRALGDPDSIEQNDEYGREDWCYEVAGIEVTFSEDWAWQLESVQAIKPVVELDGSQLIGLTEKELYGLAPSGQIVLEFESTNVREHEWDASGLTFWVEDGRVRSLSAGPRWDANGEFPLWPAANDE